MFSTLKFSLKLQFYTILTRVLDKKLLQNLTFYYRVTDFFAKDLLKKHN